MMQIQEAKPTIQADIFTYKTKTLLNSYRKKEMMVMTQITIRW